MSNYSIEIWSIFSSFPHLGERISGANMGKSLAQQRSVRFDKPTYKGYRVDICLQWASHCGQPAADAFCRSQGHDRAISWKDAPDIEGTTPTIVMGSEKICDQPHCDGFAYIECLNPQSGARR